MLPLPSGKGPLTKKIFLQFRPLSTGTGIRAEPIFPESFVRNGTGGKTLSINWTTT
jgi:hypothetical protein